MAVREIPLLTDPYESVESFVPDEGSTYVYGTSVEERSAHSSVWQARAANVKFVCIHEEEEDRFRVEVNGAGEEVSLRSGRQLGQFWQRLSSQRTYLDITGLSHHVWAPLLRTALSVGVILDAVYVEPGDYRFSPTPTEGEIFDLSERIKGIRPIPGFASLSEAPDEKVCFVPLLGFEGSRFAHVLEHVQPPGGKTVPVIGVPGFRPEYPFYTYQGNRSPLLETKAWRNVRFAKANCPFSLFYLLRSIAQEHAGDRLKIAPIGTKPHALGAVLFSLMSPDTVELIYDHPIRKSTRTAGTSKLLLYHLSAFATAGP